jgi:hypothetical protein
VGCEKTFGETTFSSKKDIATSGKHGPRFINSGVALQHQSKLLCSHGWLNPPALALTHDNDENAISDISIPTLTVIPIAHMRGQSNKQKGVTHYMTAG